MPNKNEKQRHKKIIKELKSKARQEFEESLPLSRINFKDLFYFLNENLEVHGCDHTLKFSISFLQSLQIKNIEEVIIWFKENGGYCDCEVLANVEEKFDDNAIL